MFRLLRQPLLLVSLCLISVALPALAQDLPAVQEHRQVLPVVPVTHRGVPWRDPNEARPAGSAAPAGAHLSYFGGPVISDVQVVEVLYGTGSYLAQVAGTTSPNVGTFYSDITGSNSGFTNLLSQYDTNISGGTNQIIGNGTYAGLFQISPSSGNDGSTIDDTQIQAELLAQISAGHLPATTLDAGGNVNTIYMIYFPPGKSITLSGSGGSCVAGGFCAYHGTTSSTLNGKNILYGVFPDFQPPSGCSSGCGTSTTFGNYTSVSTHELAEAITDADVGIATTFAPPLAWYDQTNGEIGDICNGQQGSYTANGTTYVVQLLFSNAANNCVLPPPPSSPNFSLSASPSSVSVTQGSNASSTITVNPSGGFTGSVTLSASGLPSGVTASFGTNPTTSTSSVTFTASATAATGTSTVTITGTSGSLTHTTTISLTVNAQVTGDFTISATPASATVTAGGGTSYTATVTGTGGFTGTVGFSVSGLPSGASASFNPTSVSGSGSSTMSVSTSTSTPAGTYTLTITGTSGSLSHSTTVTLVVNAGATPDFTISVSPSSLTVTRGTSGHYTVTITGVNGFTGTVGLSVSGQGSRVTTSFSPSSITGSGTSTLTVHVSSRATRNTRSLTISGTGGSLHHSTNATLTIQ